MLTFTITVARTVVVDCMCRGVVGAATVVFFAGHAIRVGDTQFDWAHRIAGVAQWRGLRLHKAHERSSIWGRAIDELEKHAAISAW